MSTAGRWLVLLVALGGLLAMHGLSAHGVGGPPIDVAQRSPMSTMDTPAFAHAATHAADAGASASGSRAARTTSTPPDGHGGHHRSDDDALVAAMCLAVLATLLLLGVAAWRVGVWARIRQALVDSVASAGATAFWARARSPAPPDLRLLSIQRC
ncbi:hypothetical protein GCM10023146_02130 [Nocardioides caricicola]